MKLKISNPKGIREEYISLQEAAEIYGCTQKNMALVARRGKIKAVKLGNRWVTTKSWLDEYAGSVKSVGRPEKPKETKFEIKIFQSEKGKIFKKYLTTALVSVFTFLSLVSCYATARQTIMPAIDSVKGKIEKFISLNSYSVNSLQLQAITETNKTIASVFSIDSENKIGTTSEKIIKRIVLGYKKTGQDFGRFFQKILFAIDRILDGSGRFVINTISKTINSTIETFTDTKGLADKIVKKIPIFSIIPSPISDFVISVPSTLAKIANNLIASFKSFLPLYATWDGNGDQTIVSIRDLYKKIKDLRELIEGKTLLVNETTQQITIIKPTTITNTQTTTPIDITAQLAMFKNELLSQVASDINDVQTKIGQTLVTQNNYYYSEAVAASRLDVVNNDIDFNEQVRMHKNLSVDGNLLVLGTSVFGGTVTIGGLTVDDLIINNLLTVQHASISDDFTSPIGTVIDLTSTNLTATHASVSDDLSVDGIASISGATNIYGILTLSNDLIAIRASLSDSLTVDDTIIANVFTDDTATLSAGIFTGLNSLTTTNLFGTHVSISDDLTASTSEITDLIFTTASGSNAEIASANIDTLHNTTFNTTNIFSIHASISDDLETLNAQITSASIGTLYVGGTTFSGNLDMADNLILNIGNAGTDFTTGGGLNLAGDLSGVRASLSDSLTVGDSITTNDLTASNNLITTNLFGTHTSISDDFETLNGIITSASFGTINAGTWNGSRIDISDYTNLTTTNPLSLNGDNLTIDVASTSGGGYLSSDNYTDLFGHMASINAHIDWTNATQDLLTTGSVTGTNIFGTHISASDDLSVINNLHISSGILDVDGLATSSFAGGLTIEGDVDMSGDLTVLGTTNLGLVQLSQLTVTGQADFQGNIIDSTGTLTLNDDVEISGTTGLAMLGNGAGITFSGTGDHLVSATSGIMQLGATTLAGTITGNNQNLTGLAYLTIDNLILDTNTLNTSTGDLILDSNSGTTQINDNLNVDSGVLYVDSNLNMVGINTTSLDSALEIEGNASVSGNLTIGGIQQTSGTASSSFSGIVDFEAIPLGTGISEGTIYVNPSTAGINNTLIGVAVGDTQKLRFDAEGDLEIAGTVTATGTGTSQLSGNIQVDGNAILGSDSSDTITTNGRFNSNIIPSADITYSLGSEELQWNSFYVSSMSVTNLYASGVASATFVINAENATADTENSQLEFERGTSAPNAIIKWNATSDRFEFNDFAVYVTNALTVAGTATSSFAGTTEFTKIPTGTGINDGTVYINPSAGSADHALFGVAVSGVERFRVDAEGDTTIQGGLGIENSLYDISQDTLTVNDDLQINGNDIKDSASITRITLGDTTTLTASLVNLTGDLKVSGNDIQSSTGDTVLTLANNDATFADQLTINGKTLMSSTASVSGDFQVDATDDVFYVDSLNNKVGIGTIDPQESLHITGNMMLNAGGDVIFGDTNTRIYEASDDLSITAHDDIYLEPVDDLWIKAYGGTDFVRFDTGTQTVGINTSNATNTLEVDGTASISGAVNLGSNLTLAGTLTSPINLFTHASVSNDFETISAQITSASVGTLNVGTLNPITLTATHVSVSDDFETLNGQISSLSVTGVGSASFAGMLDIEGDVNIGNNDLYVDASTGYVGIGTTNPSGLLPANNGLLTVSSSDYTRIVINSTINNAGFRLAESGVAMYDIASYGGGTFSIYDVVRGTDSWKMDNRGNFTFNASDLAAPTLTANSVTAWKFQNPGGELVGGISPNSPYPAWLQVRVINSAASLPLVLQPISGNVGIGDENPTYTLSVDGTASISGTFYVDTFGNTSTSSFAGPLTVVGGIKQTESGVTNTYLENTGLRMQNIYTTVAGWARHLLTYQDDDEATYFAIGAVGSGQTFTNAFIGTSYDHTWQTWNSSEVIINENSADIDFRVESDNDTAALFVQGSDGNVGIGTGTPATKLDVFGAYATSSYAGNESVSTPVARIFSTNESALNRGGALMFGGETGSATTPYQFAEIVGGKDSSTVGQYGGNLQFWTTSSGENSETNSDLYERMRIDDAGNVGIGDTAPAYKLSVDGTASISGLTIFDNVLDVNGTASSTFAGDLDIEGNVNIGANDLYVDASSGNVGIGTVAPSQKLQVSGNAYVTNFMSIGGGTGVDVQANVTLTSLNNAAGGVAVWGLNYNGSNGSKGVYGYGYITSGSGTNYGVYGSVVNASSLATTNVGGYFTATATGGTAYALITGDGNVGIGTAAPATKLDIDTASNTLGLRLRGTAETTEIADIYVQSGGSLILSTANTGAGTSYIEVDAEDNEYGFIIRDSNTGSTVYSNLYMVDSAGEDYLAINVESAVDGDALVVTDTNRVGIGTTNVLNKLTVADTVGQNLMLSRYDASITTGDLLGRIAFVGGDDGVGSDAWDTVDGSAVIGAYAAESHGGSDRGGYLTFSTKAIDANPDASATEAMRIDSTGYVGIGDTAPAYHLSVDGAASISGLSYFGDEVEFSDATNTQITIKNPGGSGNALLMWDDSAGNADYYFGETDGDGDMYLYNYTYGNYSMVFDTTGRIGMGGGDASPDAGVEIMSSGSIGYLAVTSDEAGAGNGNLFIVDENGYVGINDAAPGYYLSVDGTASISGALTLDSTLVMGGALTVSGTATSSFAGGLTVAGDLDIQSGTLFVDDSSGNVGIGTAAPSAKLDIVPTAGVALELGRVAGSPNIKSSDTYLFMDSNGSSAGLNWYVADSVILAHGGGNVGIGDDAPAYRLSVDGTASISSTLQVDGATTLASTLTVTGAIDSNGGISINDTDIAFDGASTTFTVTGALSINAGSAITISDGNDTVAINSSDWDISTTGDMTGIGAITANGALAVDSTASISGTLFVNGAVTLTTDLTVANGGTGASTFTANGILYGNTTSAIQVTAAGTSAQIFQANATGVPGFVTFSGDASVAVGGAVTVADDSHAHIITNIDAFTSLELATRLSNETGSGAAVFGTSPTFTTSVIMADGATLGQAAGPLLTFDDTNNYLEIAGANVGIGTTVPLALLQVGTPAAVSPGTIGVTPKLRVLGANQTSTEDTILRLVRDTSNGVHYGGTADFKMKSYSDATASPYTQLTIGLKNGDTLTETGNIDVLTLRDNGSVGIGTTAPTINASSGLHIGGTTSELHLTSTAGGAAATDGSIVQQYSDNVLYIYNRENAGMVLGTNNAGRIEIAAGGAVTIPNIATGSPAYVIETNGVLAAGGWADLAEYMPLDSINYESGELISARIPTQQEIDNESTKESFIGTLSSVSYDSQLIGVVSQPGTPGLGPVDKENYKAITLVGRVPVKVSTENGPISVGDYLTSSTTPGVAMKATKPGTVIGKALEAFPNTSSISDNSSIVTGSILVFVNLTWYGGEINSNGTLGTIVETSSPLFPTSELMASVFQGLKDVGVEIYNGILKVAQIVVKTLVVEKNSDQTQSSIGEGVIKAEETSVMIESNQVILTSKIFVTFRSDYGSRWWIGYQEKGRFTVNIADPLSEDIKFDWWIVQTEQVEITETTTEIPAEVPTDDVGAETVPEVPAETTTTEEPVTNIETVPTETTTTEPEPAPETTIIPADSVETEPVSTTTSTELTTTP